jgi:tripartite-type tricarboxylate transporter receptor subunit TctC
MWHLARRHVWLFPVAVACVTLSIPEASAQTYPVKPVHMVVGYPPGGAVDFTARLFAQKLSDSLGQPVIVENRPGSSTAIATDRVAKAPADGYTLLLIPTSAAVQSALRKDLPYDLERDLAPVLLLSIGPYVLVAHPSVPANNVKELIALARAKPGTLNYGSAGLGSANHLAGALFGLMANVNIVHVPYKGTGEAAIGAASGQAPLSFLSVAGALPLLENRKLKALAVTSVKRAALLPSLPTVSEAGLPGYDYVPWYGVSTTAGVPKEIITRLNTLLGKIALMPEVKDALNKQGFEPQPGAPDEFAAVIHREIERTVKLIRLTGLKAE